MPGPLTPQEAVCSECRGVRYGFKPECQDLGKAFHLSELLFHHLQNRAVRNKTLYFLTVAVNFILALCSWPLTGAGMLLRGAKQHLLHRRTWGFLGEKNVGPCGRWEFSRGDLPCSRRGSSQCPGQPSRMEIPAEEGCFLVHHVSNAGILSPPLTGILSYFGFSPKQT